jgi:hypothetical protein
MYKNEPNALCLLCEKDGETIEHFILDCEQLKEVREPPAPQLYIKHKISGVYAVYIFRTIPVMPLCFLVPCLSIIFL